VIGPVVLLALQIRSLVMYGTWRDSCAEQVTFTASGPRGDRRCGFEGVWWVKKKIPQTRSGLRERTRHATQTSGRGSQSSQVRGDELRLEDLGGGWEGASERRSFGCLVHETKRRDHGPLEGDRGCVSSSSRTATYRADLLHSG
jgi:hypothetical protein